MWMKQLMKKITEFSKLLKQYNTSCKGTYRHKVKYLLYVVHQFN